MTDLLVSDNVTDQVQSLVYLKSHKSQGELKSGTEPLVQLTMKLTM